ncbi:hypothetical protein EXM22_15695 [Oceanispirochaeta crateris]|jgi:hypothetical protein|uniref:Uncharacterized protein n=1 Tax=Oceanispirochaeta crateris TaxID=2518645 RepID=A0A5C1QQ76_9SPIO|nr:hypothetical protein [Oceanispirochaeta crateris]QEN09349.1 hypothetical protein EXM22_15695 [Oceanispirochaeta crateris]
MRYQFEYYYIYKEMLLLGDTIENMEELLEIAATEQMRRNSAKRENRAFSGQAQRVASSSR